MPLATKQFILLSLVAGTTRLELATSAVTGRRSNQLSYVPKPRSIRQRSDRHQSTRLRGNLGRTYPPARGKIPECKED